MSTVQLSRESIVYLPKGVRMREDEVRGRTILVAPERTIALDDIGIAILSEIDGERSLAEMVENLATRFNAPKQEIGNDVVAFVRDLITRGYLEIAT